MPQFDTENSEDEPDDDCIEEIAKSLNFEVDEEDIVSWNLKIRKTSLHKT